MATEFDGSASGDRLFARVDDGETPAALEPAGSAVDQLEIALLNNMPDAAVEATERQFTRLLRAAAGKRRVHLHFFALPEIPRSAASKARLDAAYSPVVELRRGRFDGLIVTGTEPRAASLVDEPYWTSLTDIVDWAEHNTLSTIWSCLAAHVAALHLDGVARRPFAEKCSGVFECVGNLDDPILARVPTPLSMPHSRWNDLRESDLVAHGYRVLTRSAAGVDLFAKQWRSLFLFLQGHPEYEANSLLLEYRRDVGRFLRGERESYPTMPAGYFDGPSERALTAFGNRAASERHPDLMASYPKDVAPHLATADRWQASGAALMRNWLSYLAAQKS